MQVNQEMRKKCIATCFCLDKKIYLHPNLRSIKKFDNANIE